eukprot:12420108-Karenia_brevis.AAC.1
MHQEIQELRQEIFAHPSGEAMLEESERQRETKCMGEEDHIEIRRAEDMRYLVGPMLEFNTDFRGNIRIVSKKPEEWLMEELEQKMTSFNRLQFWHRREICSDFIARTLEGSFDVSAACLIAAFLHGSTVHANVVRNNLKRTVGNYAQLGQVTILSSCEFDAADANSSFVGQSGEQGETPILFASEHQAVIQEVDHHEPVAPHDEDTAHEIANALAASWLLYNADAGWLDNDESEHCGLASQNVYIGKLNRNPHSLHASLCAHASLQRCRTALENAGLSWKLPGGSLVFVHPWQHSAVVEALGSKDQPGYIVFAESMEHLLEEAMAACEKVKGGWITKREQLHFSQPGNLESTMMTQISRSPHDELSGPCMLWPDTASESDWQ